MKYLRAFETFDFNQTIPVTSKEFLNTYWSCDECDSLWRQFNSTCDKCKYCNSHEIEELPKNEWMDIAKQRLTEEEFSDLLEDDDEMVNLTNLDLD